MQQHHVVPGIPFFSLFSNSFYVYSRGKTTIKIKGVGGRGEKGRKEERRKTSEGIRKSSNYDDYRCRYSSAILILCFFHEESGKGLRGLWRGCGRLVEGLLLSARYTFRLRANGQEGAMLEGGQRGEATT